MSKEERKPGSSVEAGSESPTQADLLRQTAAHWLATAEHDLAVARALNKDPDVAYLAAIAFHSQQCVEKAMKAVLIRSSAPFPRTHDLERLADLLVSIGVTDVGVNRTRLAVLTQYAVESRYADGDPVSPAEAGMASEDADHVLERMRGVLTRLG